MPKILKRDKNRLIREWYDALMSGEFSQCSGILQEEGEYCCLGVLCRVAGYKDALKGDGRIAGEDAVLPGSLDRLFSVDPELKVPNKLCKRVPKYFFNEDMTMTVSASELNDACKFTFEQIAACIKETWPEAFEEKKNTDG